MLITQADYAARRGWTRQYVNKLVGQGRIPVHGPRKLIDPDEADRLVAATSDPARTIANPPPAPAATPAAPPEGAAAPAARSPLFHQARTAKVGYEAKIAQLEYEQRIGNLVAAEEVRDAAFELGQVLRQLMAGRVEALAAELKRLAPALALDDAANAIIASDHKLQQQIADALQQAFGQGVSDEAQAA